MSIPSQVFFKFINPPTGVAGITIVNATTYDLLTGTTLTLEVGNWLVCLTGEVSNPTAGAITATNLTLNLQSTTGSPLILNDQLIPFDIGLPAGISYYFTKTYALPVTQGNQTMQFELYNPQVTGAGLTLAYKLYCIRLA
jgi:hypothetical protein